ncbi:uncharacterized protein JCM6883_006458 [Sporobolomyces salmoneus]|uniref:uncharacterized protein n=1 Tax=Sporobolomyces salmoneus TaxID=183962 RepID=UPI00317EDA45
MLTDTTNTHGIPPPEPFEVDPCPPPPVPCSVPLPPSSSSTTTSSIPRSTSSKHRPSTPSSVATTTGGSMTWREEESILKHQLRSAKAEIAQLQAKLGMKNNAVPFNSSSPSRKSISVSSPSPPSDVLLSHSSSERQLSVSPTANRTRRTSLASSSNSNPAESSTTGPPPPSAPLPPVPSLPSSASTTPATRIPVAINSIQPPGVGPVALNRALLSNEGQSKSSPPQNPSLPLPAAPSSETSSSIPTVSVPSLTTTDSTRSSPSEADFPEALDRSLSPPPILLAARQSRLSDPTYTRTTQYLASTSRPENPFFSSGTPARERLSKSASSAMSGSGKVISGLQSELLLSKNALESTRGQLRLSQRAVDFLGRQNEDLKETKERLNNEIDSLTRQLTRRERTTEETLSRARLAESSLSTLQIEHKQYVSSHKSRTKELEESEKRAKEELKRVEMEYEGLRDGVKSMQGGWKRDLEWLKQSFEKKEKDLEAKSNALEKLLKNRTELSTSLSSTIESLSTTTTKFNTTFASETSTALRSLELLNTRQREDSEKVEVVRGEMGRLRRNIERAERGEKEREQVEL